MSKKYGLLTAISMVVGIVIGSGIFFKTDDILRNTDGSVAMGIIVFVIGAMGIIFGGLAIATLSNETDKAGGMVTYVETLYKKRMSKYVGYFYLFVYNPSLTAVIIWVAALYIGMLFGYAPLSQMHWFVSIGLAAFLFTINLAGEKLGGHFQTSTTAIKLILLFVIAVLGIFYGKSDIVVSDITMPTILASSSALVAVAFSYDGWALSTSISHEVKNGKRNMPLALILGPLVVLVIYIFYFVGVTSVLSPNQIIELGDGHVAEVASHLLGANGYNIILTGVTLSVLGTANGLVLGLIRIPFSLAIRDELPRSDQFTKLSNRSGMPLASGIFAAICCLFWLFVHYLSTVVPSLDGFDASSLPIIINYFAFEAVYLGLIYRNIKDKRYGFIKGFVVPFFAAIGGLLVLYGGFQDPFIWHYLGISIGILVTSILVIKGLTRKQSY